MALNTTISSDIAIGMCNFAVDELDEGTLGCIVQGYTTAQPTNPDVAIGGQTLLFTCQQATTTSFGNATDVGGAATATANTYNDDTSADATGTLDWVRISSSSVADTSLQAHIDGDADTSGADFNFNTLSIVSGSTVSITAHTVTVSET